MLFDPLEEQLDLPPAAIQLGDGSRRQVDVVRQENQCFALVVLDANPAQRCWVVLSRIEARQCADLIADDAGRSIRFQGVPALEAQVRLGANDIEAVEFSFATDALLIADPGAGIVGDRDDEVLADLVSDQRWFDRTPDQGGTTQRSFDPADPGGDAPGDDRGRRA